MVLSTHILVAEGGRYKYGSATYVLQRRFAILGTFPGLVVALFGTCERLARISLFTLICLYVLDR